MPSKITETQIVTQVFFKLKEIKSHVRVLFVEVHFVLLFMVDRVDGHFFYLLLMTSCAGIN